MTSRLRKMILNRLGYLLLGISLHATATEPASVTLPDWKVLQLEQKAFWATARSRIEVKEAGDHEGAWTLAATSSVVGNSEEVEVTLEPGSGQVITRSRLSRGKDQRLKTFDYGPDFILRERRNHDKKSKKPPAEWPISSTHKIPYPEPRQNLAVTDDYTLLLLADRLQASSSTSKQVVVHTEFNFYSVRMTVGNGIPVMADYQVTGGEQVKGMRDTRAVVLLASPLGEQVDKPDFSLLGLQGEIILFFDKDSGLLLQVRGTAPRIGETEVNLKTVTMREPAE